MAREAISLEKHPAHKKRVDAVQQGAKFSKKKFKSLSDKEKDELLHAMALKLGMVDRDE